MYFKTSLPRKLSLQSYRERYRPNRMRNAKYPMKTHVSERYFPGSIVCQTSTANTPMTASAIHILPLPAGLRSTTFQRSTRTSQTSGAQGRIRTSVTRRVADLQSAAINHSATCAHPAKPSEQTTLISTHQAPSNDPMPRIERVTSTLKKSREACMTRTASSTTKSVFLPLQTSRAASGNWSWRRDLNPRPSDYKSDALPAELRQPKQPSFTAKSAPCKRNCRMRSHARAECAAVVTLA